MTMLAIYRSRSHALLFAQRLSSFGVKASVSPTPKEAEIGCGLCVKFDSRDYPKARAAAMTTGGSFKGFYGYGYREGKLAIMPVYR